MEPERLCRKFEAAFELLGKRWTGLIIRSLLMDRHRFSEFLEMIPSISDRMLAERLKELEALGLVERRVYPETPVRIEYHLTEMGNALEPVMDQVQRWADRWVVNSRLELPRL